MKNFVMNSVLDKEVKIRFRNKKTFTSIGFYLFVLCFLLLGILFLSGYKQSSYSNPGELASLFYVLAYIQFGLIMFLIPAISAGVISTEREKQTLNMLLTTTQSSFSIIFSKLISSVMFLVLLVIASMPIYSFIFLFGGVSPLQLLAVIGMLIFIIFCFASIGVCISTFVRKTIVSVVITYCVSIFLLGGTLFILLLISMTSNVMVDWASYILLAINPIFAMISVVNPEVVDANLFGTPVINWPIWASFILFYSITTALLLKLCSSKLRPNMKKG